MPVRLRLAKLSKRLVAVEERWEKSCAVTDVDAVDPVEIKLENQVGLIGQTSMFEMYSFRLIMVNIGCHFVDISSKHLHIKLVYG